MGAMVSIEVCGTSVDTEVLEAIDATISGTATHAPIEGVSCVESDVGILFILSSQTTHACSDPSVFERTISSN